ncbi:ribosome assembly protein RRB1 [Strigomonas culicis]|uniref:Ribosome assembly protein RRB1 n=2 Tax=Strigomonas culicis TaxID=28005 RepID=S9UD61_9TRYP|nr:ribosome assembly protein RRB1 [Strigomonas culicis]|eukprot:EPY28757.1 ribosome assembly protein RRB1 [Strigomonas culicis]
MKKGVKRSAREEEEARPVRQRKEGVSAKETAEAEEEDHSSAEWSDDAEDEGLYDDMEDEDEEEIIDDEDDEDYEDFQKESSGALTKALKSVSFADDAADNDKADVAVFRADQEMEGMEEGMKLEFSNKAYDSFFQLRTEYPCLSFDVITDPDGSNRTKYPLSMMLVCGSQADELSKNHLVVLRVSNICRTKHDEEDDDDSEDSFIGDEGESEESDGEEAEEVNDGEPIVNHRTITHHGTANRVRCCPHKDSQLVAVWSDAGHVQVFDLSDDVRILADFANWSKEQAKAWKGADKKKSPLKFCTPASTHQTEGYALDWSPLRQGVFASGDCNGTIFAWQPTDDGRWRCVASNTDAGMSVEELQWSPTQGDVLLSARAGGVVEVWDTRDMRASKVRWQADPTDINVADWNRARQASHLLVTGADSGAVAVWDLRKLSATEPIQRLPWHKRSITSVEFSMHNESVLSVTADDGQCTLWDLSLERDPSEEQQVIGELFNRADLTGIPDQLMFQHQGLTHPKEAHWHSQIPGMVVTTDYEGLNLFRPMNWRSLMK